MTALKIAWREARASRFKFTFVVLGIAVGVGALTGVRGFSAAFSTLLKKEARTMMAADVAVRQFSPATPAQQDVIDDYERRGALMTPLTETVSMMSAPGTDTPVLVSVKAVDPSRYPFYGVVKLEPEIPLIEALTPDAVAVSDDLVLRLNVSVGGMVKLGGQEFRVAAVTRSEPDRMTGSLNVGPRILMSRAGLERTGLMTAGSRAPQRFLFKLPAQGIDVGEMRTRLKSAFPDAQVVDYRETHPAIKLALERSTTFLSLISLIALIVGALGVATSIHAHLQHRLDSIAIMKCLGARSWQIIRIYTLETALLGLAGGVAGVAVGFAVQRLFPLLIRKYFQSAGEAAWSPAFALEGILTGVLVSLLFTLPPLLSIRKIRPALIFRREMPEVKPAWRVRIKQMGPAATAGLLICAGLAGLAGWLAESPRIGAYFVFGLLLALLALSLIAAILLRVVRWFVRTRVWRLPVTLRQGLMNLYRPGNHAGSVLVALGIGVMFILTIYLVQKSLLVEVINTAPPGMPNVFLINITESNREGIRQLLERQTGLKKKPEITPLVAARIVSIEGRALDAKELKGHNHRLAQTRSVTWADIKPEDVSLRRGAWWAANTEEKLFSVSEDAADVLHLAVGQRVEWQAAGRNFQVRVAAIHRNWAARMGGNNEFYFTRAALAGFPVQYFGAVRIPAAQVGPLQRDAYRMYPTVTVINAADVISIVQDIVDQVAMVVRFISAFAILAGAIILAATVAGTRLRRVREAAVLKTLGARRSRLVGIFSVEFLVLGSVAGLMGGVLATGFTRVLLTRLLDAPFHFDVLPNLASIVLTALVAMAAGWLASVRILSQKPLEVLRDE